MTMHWRMGVIGLGVAGRSAVTAATTLGSRVTVTVGSDPAPPTNWPPAGDFRIGATAEDVCRADDVDVVYVASPSSLHREHTLLAARHGKHVLVEKPMAVSLADCTAIVDAARAGGVHVVAAHTPSFAAPLRTARAIVDSGRVGRPLHLTLLTHVPWLDRPREPHELDNDLGGGVINRQAPHQVDAALYLLGGRPTTLHATAGSHPGRPRTDGHYTAVLGFAEGWAATMIFNGYGYFGSAALNGGVGEDGHHQVPGAGQRLRRMRGATKQDMRSGRIHEIEHGYAGAGPRFAPLAGWTLLSCEDADLVLTPHGVAVHGADSTQEIPNLASDGPLAAALDELELAVETGAPPRHDARWGRRIVEIVAGIRTAAGTGATITLTP